MQELVSAVGRTFLRNYINHAFEVLHLQLLVLRIHIFVFLTPVLVVVRMCVTVLLHACVGSLAERISSLELRGRREPAVTHFRHVFD